MKFKTWEEKLEWLKEVNSLNDHHLTDEELSAFKKAFERDNDLSALLDEQESWKIWNQQTEKFQRLFNQLNEAETNKDEQKRKEIWNEIRLSERIDGAACDYVLNSMSDEIVARIKEIALKSLNSPPLKKHWELAGVLEVKKEDL